jgi:hypothetical protein
MPLNLRASKKFKNFDLPVSFKMGESRDRFRDALNVFSNQGRLETRFGRSLHAATLLPGPVLSISYFENTLGDGFLLAKVGTILYRINATGEHTQLKTGLSANTKHRGLTWARGSSSRHIIAIEGDGLFQYNGTTFTQLGQVPPAAPTIAATTGSLTNATYRVGITFYSSSTGFESNLSALSNQVATTAQGLNVTSIAATAANATIDKVRIYLKNAGSPAEAVYAGEVNLGTTTFLISNNPVSTEIAPIANAAPLAGGGRFITTFNRKLVYAGNETFRNDVYFSEMDLPDGFNDGTADDRLVLYASLDGAITGLATGLYSNSVLDPFLVVFKRRSTHIYSEINGAGKFIPISKEIGCVSHDTISVKNGVVYFLSEQGWRAIANGQLVSDQSGNPITLGDGDIDDIFRSPGYAYEANVNQLSNAFSVYYSVLDQYMTWMAEGGDNAFTKTYVYEHRINGFKPYQFLTPSTCATVGRHGGHEVVFMADADGAIYRHSVSEARKDDDKDGITNPISAFAQLVWMDGDDMDASYNFRELILRRLAGAGDLSVRIWVNFDIDDSQIETFINPLSGFILDISQMDVDSFGTSERSVVTGRADIHRVGENILIGFYQNGIEQNIALVTAQVEMSKNGNRNL